MTEKQLMEAIIEAAGRLGYLGNIPLYPEVSGIMDAQQKGAGAVLVTLPGVAPRRRRSEMRTYSSIPLEQRFWAKVEKLPSGCWRWTAFCDKAGYARLRQAGRGSEVLYAHRLSYEMHKGPIPVSRVLDHLCRNRWCVNPDHLEAVSNRVNVMRGVAPTVLASVAGICTRGHSLDGDNLYVSPQGKRQCRTCRRLRRERGRG
jgi:hypothetical protein